MDVVNYNEKCPVCCLGSGKNSSLAANLDKCWPIFFFFFHVNIPEEKLKPKLKAKPKPRRGEETLQPVVLGREDKLERETGERN